MTNHHALFALTTALACVTIAAPTEARAQDEERSPLKLVVLNVAQKGGSPAVKAIARELEDNDAVELLDSEDVTIALRDFDLDESSLRKSSTRRKYSNRIYRLMRAQGIEGLLLVDVYSKGRKVQLVVIGPEGDELTDLKESTKRGRLSKSEARGMLRGAFQELGPAVLEFRENQAAIAETPEDSEDPFDASSEGGAGVEDKATRDPDAGSALETATRIGLGVFLGRRGLDVREGDATDDFRLTHASPFVGAGARIDLVPYVGGDNAFGVTLTGAYAPFVTIFGNAEDGTTEELSSAHIRVGGQLSYLRALGARSVLDVWGGAEYSSISIAANPFYTGNQYVYGRAGLGFTYRFNADASVRAHAGALPTFSADNSGGAFGPSPFSLGYEGGASLALSLSENIFFRLDYTFQLLSPDYPEPVAPITAQTRSTDIFNTGNVLVGFTL